MITVLYTVNNLFYISIFYLIMGIVCLSIVISVEDAYNITFYKQIILGLGIIYIILGGSRLYKHFNGKD